MGDLPAACQVEPEVSSAFSSKHDIAPALMGEMIGEPAAHDSAADDDDPRRRTGKTSDMGSSFSDFRWTSYQTNVLSSTMNDTNVPYISSAAPQAVLDALAGQLDDMTPELRKAAAFVLENPNEVGVSSMREIAEAANVKPNTVVRMARHRGI
jgi:hypothetical protein